MKLVGFLSEHNEYLENTSKEYLFDLSTSEKEEIITYLEKGIMFIPFLHWINDMDTKKPIGPQIIRTDGIYIWPDYFKYYLQTNRAFVDKGFLEHIKIYHFQNLNKKTLLALHNEFMKINRAKG